LIDRKIVEPRAIDRRESFQLVERVFLLEHRRIAFECIRRVEDSSAAARAFLRMTGMGCAVGAAEDIGLARNRRLADGDSMLLALGHGAAVSVGATARTG